VHQELGLLKPKDNTQLPGASPKPPLFLCFVLGAGILRDFALDSENSSILAWRILMDRGAWQATVHEVTKESDTVSN